MADTKLTALSAMTTPTDDDLIYTVNDPAGTPASNKLTMANLKTFVQASLGNRGVSQQASANAATSVGGVTVTGSGSINTKGAYAELITSTGFAAETIVIGLVSTIGTNGTNTSTLLDIAFGAAASEVVKISNISIGFARVGATFIIPFAVPSGTRISARLQGATASQVAVLTCEVRQAGTHSAAPTTSVTYNADTTTSNATTVLTGVAGTNAEGAWTQLTASTSADMRFLMVCLTGSAGATHQAGNSLVDIATGAAASEVAIISDLQYVTNTSETPTWATSNMPYTVSVAAGSRISARYQCDSTNTAARPNVVLIGFN